MLRRFRGTADTMAANNESLPVSRATSKDRRHDYDVTNTVKVSSIDQVRAAVGRLFRAAYPTASFDLGWMAFHDFRLLFEGRMPGHQGCDTVYHDKQHTLDVTLAMARLIAGHERSVAAPDRLGEYRATVGLITALLHDSGYILGTTDTTHHNCAEYTRTHVSRSAAYLRDYLPTIGLAQAVPIATEIVHFTGYERNLDEIELDNPKDSLIGHLLGTADLVAQMADRCYLEKCRDRLYCEFVLAGIAICDQGDGFKQVRYQSGVDLLRQTPAFYRDTALKRLDGYFSGAYRYIEALYNGRNPYMEAIDRNLNFLERIIETGEWPELRRNPPCFTVKANAVSATNVLVNRYLNDIRNSPVVLGKA